MMQDISIPLISKLLQSSRVVSRKAFPLRNCNAFRHSHINGSRLQSQQIVLSTSARISKSFQSSHHGPDGLQSENNSSRVYEGSFLTHQISSSTNVYSRLFQGQNLSSFTSSLSYIDVEVLNQESPLYNQLRFIHKYSSRKRVNRTFSSQKNSTTSSTSTDIDKKDEKPGDDIDNDGDKQLTVYQRFKKTYKEHGKVLVVVHLLTSSVWLGSFYAAAKCGVDVVPLLESWNLNEKFISPFRSGGLGSLALAYLMYKLATPARYTVTLGGTNLVIRNYKKKGKIQPVAKEDRLRELYKDGKHDLKTKGTETKDKLTEIYKDRKENLKSKGTNTGHSLRSMRKRIQGGVKKDNKRQLRDRRNQ